jgi:hypothetical protein
MPRIVEKPWPQARQSRLQSVEIIHPTGCPIMIRSIVILLLSLAATSAADGKSRREEFRVRARVQDIVLLSSFSGIVTVIGRDPRFAVTLKIESVTPALRDPAAGSTVTLAVHSPALFFGVPDAKGKSYDFTLRRDAADGKSQVSDWEVRR